MSNEQLRNLTKTKPSKQSIEQYSFISSPIQCKQFERHLLWPARDSVSDHFSGKLFVHREKFLVCLLTEENQLLKLLIQHREKSVESLHIIRSRNMQTRYCCCHDTCLPLPSLDDQTYIYIYRHSENEKKSHCLKQTNAKRGEKEEREKSSNVKQQYFNTDRNHRRERETY